MDIKSLSISGTGTFYDCEWKFYLSYILGIRDDTSKKALLGNLVHTFGEILARTKKTGHYKLKDKYTDPHYLLDIIWARYTKEYGNEMVFLEEDYIFCQEQIKAIMESKFNPLKLKVIGTEQEFEFELLRKGFKTIGGSPLKTRGIIDLVYEKNKTTLGLLDYKTGQRKDWVTNKVKTLEDFKQDHQLRLYDLIASKIYPQYPNREITIFYTRDGGPFTVSFTDEDRENTIDTFRRTYNEIKYVEVPTRLKDDRSREASHWKCRKVCSFGMNGECDKFWKLYRSNQMEQLAQISIERKILKQAGKRASSAFTNPSKGEIK